MNEGFVAIKVDREERPDVDATYMAFVQATTGGGGWPMTVFLTTDLKPFVGGTYFPPEDRDGQPGLKTILPEIADAWRQHARRSAPRPTRSSASCNGLPPSTHPTKATPPPTARSSTPLTPNSPPASTP